MKHNDLKLHFLFVILATSLLEQKCAVLGWGQGIERNSLNSSVEIKCHWWCGKKYINLANSLINKLMCDIIRAAWQSAILAQWATWLQTVSVSVKNWDCSNSHDTKGVDIEPNPLTIIQQQRHKCVYHSSLVPIINRWGAGGVTYIIIYSDGQQQALATSSNKQG